jgi:hypothetical protein
MTRCGAASEVERDGANWGKAAEGIQLAGIAVFLLLNTTGALPWSFWLDAIALWPVLIMSAGLKIAFEKSRAPWLLLLGPVLVLGSLGWLASGRRPEGPVGPWNVESLSRPEGTRTVDFEAALVGARLRLAFATDLPADRLVDGRSIVNRENTRLESRDDEGVARVRIDSGKKHGIVFLPRPRERWDLRLPADLPAKIEVKGAGVGGDLDLTASTPERLEANGVFIGLDARLPAPRRNTNIQINGVFNSLALVVPEGTPVRVHGTGLPFNAVDRGVAGIEGRPGYDVSVQGIFSAVDVRTDRTISPEPPPAPMAPPDAPPAEAPLPEPSRPPAEAEPKPIVG